MMKKTLFLLLSLAFACTLGRAEPRSVTLGSSQVRAEICYDADAGHAFLKSISCPKNGTRWELAGNQPLFILHLSDRSLSSVEGWSSIRVEKKGKSARLFFQSTEGFCVEVCLEWHRDLHIRWGECRFPDRSQLNSSILFPMAFRQLPEGTRVFFPYSSGLVYETDHDRISLQSREYPSGFGASMAWFALWDSGNRGLYFAAHDRKATKKMLRYSIPEKGCVSMEFSYPACEPEGPHPGIVPCEIVLRSYDGNWFDAAQIYKKWMKEESFWYTQVHAGKLGRRDTPQWMKELCVWVSGTDEKVAEFRRQIGIPVGLHWYSWHEIPFDNDYPHYFPAREHFAKKVRQLREEGVYIMPYINGRLWDTRDHGMRDSLFSSYAFPAATKDKEGKANIEFYGSKEEDDSNVELAVMCPGTELWQRKMKEVVLKLLAPPEEGGYGVDAVYMDQIAAAPPVSCWDKSHPHPGGGGDWWVPAYTKLLQDIRHDMPEGKALTTESNADGYVGVMDGYLTWQFQDNKQVPAFAAVYGGMIQLFGRGYDLKRESLQATRMRMVQSFVFGEQLGWLEADILNDRDRFPLLKSLARLRYRFRDYFYMGEMVHFPTLYGENPPCKDVWYFPGKDQTVEVPSVMCSAWQRLDGQSGIVILGNCSDRDREVQVVLPPELAPLARKGIVRYGGDGSSERMKDLSGQILVPVGSAIILELGNREMR